MSAKSSTRAKLPGRIQSGSSLRLIDVAELTRNPDNIRTYDAYRTHIDSLKVSIKASGVLVPINVYPDGVIADGNTRFTAINELLAEGIDTSDDGRTLRELQALIVEREPDKKRAIINQIARNRGEQFDPLDQARAFSDLRREGMTNADIERETGFKAVWVSMMLTLIDHGNDEVFTAIRTGRLSATLAAETLRTHDGDATLIVEALDLAFSQGKNKATQRHVDAVLTTRAEAAEAEANAGQNETDVQNNTEAQDEATTEPETDVQPERRHEPAAPAKAPTAPKPTWTENDITDIKIDTTAPAAEIETEVEVEVDAQPEGHPEQDAQPEPATDDDIPFDVYQAPASTPAAASTTPDQPAPDQPNGKMSLAVLKAEMTLVIPSMSELVDALANGTDDEVLEIVKMNADVFRTFLANAKKHGIASAE